MKRGLEIQIDVKTEGTQKRPDVLIWTMKGTAVRTLLKLEGKTQWAKTAEKTGEDVRVVGTILESFRFEVPWFYADMTPKLALAMVDEKIAVYVVAHVEKAFIANKAGVLPVITRIPTGIDPGSEIKGALAQWRGFKMLLYQLEASLQTHRSKVSTTAVDRLFPLHMLQQP
ncbi:hypothetical protein HDU87_006578 [Geranomyces variabilis]|uniref:Uncharacterized protein n=1 Tax=Geranomyces variabilis TaxID=109894 RepID=A0AAD5TG82_9FUNG|nr:hypothetical protein HDU87_006578 [Geranomyces variabilis]